MTDTLSTFTLTEHQKNALNYFSDTVENVVNRTVKLCEKRARADLELKKAAGDTRFENYEISDDNEARLKEAIALGLNKTNEDQII